VLVYAFYTRRLDEGHPVSLVISHPIDYTFQTVLSQMKQLSIVSILLLLQIHRNSSFAPSSSRLVPRWRAVGPTGFHSTHHKVLYPITAVSTGSLHMTLDPLVIPESTSILIESIFTSSHPVPLSLSLAVNSLLFLALRTKLNKVLTAEGYMHALALGTMLWHCVGWKGWSVCVLYLVLGSLVTKVSGLVIVVVYRETPFENEDLKDTSPFFHKSGKICRETSQGNCRGSRRSKRT
jgi:hypothetical protein